ncbi:MAG: hypothetical protein KatS3mg033_0409 [Thermonema sp.]|jgi:hypothetical protein|uniref:T9SS type A sorting domain-containing protein n=1 Tax=Thermonema TaxID=28194 RepID=UPI00056F2205|nr:MULTISPECIES: T9SS type A sorting domain-containing protein [Thermonema]GIV38609.1 MAG: hypothetical protein KatS3mg033_0409 [Thermonema sp.]
MGKFSTYLLLVIGLAGVAQGGAIVRKHIEHLPPTLTNIWVEESPEEAIDIFNPIDFEVQAIGNRRFIVRFYNDTDGVFLRVYDVIGNLVYQERVTKKGNYVKEFDMSHARSDVYIVEVGNTKYSTTKRVFLK